MHRSRLLCLAAVLIALSIISSLPARAQETFVARGSGTTQNLWGVAYGGGQYIAVGEGGTILRSPDGVAWTSTASGTTDWLLSVTYGHGQWVVVGDAGLVLTSPDGITWTKRATAISTRLNAVIPLPLGFFAVGESGRRLYSADGVEWQTRADAGSVSVRPWLRGLIYDAGTVRYSGSGGFLGETVAWRSAAETIGNYTTFRYFSSRNADLADQPIEGLALGAGTRIAVGHGGNIWSSRETSTWQTRGSGTTQGLRAASFQNGRFYAVGDSGTILRSDNGETWQRLISPTVESLVGIAGTDASIVTVGYRGTILRSSLSGQPPSITRQPVMITEHPGASVALEARAAGSAPLRFQWQKNGQPLSEQTGPYLNLTDLTTNDAGLYSLTVSNAYGRITSNPAPVHVIQSSTPYSPVDPTFDTGGYAGGGTALLVLPDDSILLGTSVTDNSSEPGLRRFTPDGSLDPGFKVGAGLPGGGKILALARQADGKILVGGTFGSWDGQPASGLVRLLPSGAVDSSFRRTVQFPANTVSSLRVLSDGRVIAHLSYVLLADGDNDSTFVPPANLRGLIPHQSGGFIGVVKDPPLIPNSSENTYARVVRLSSTGQIVAETGHRFLSNAIVRLDSLPEGRILAVVGEYYRTSYAYSIQAWNADGTRDETFRELRLSRYAGSGLEFGVQPLPERQQIAVAVNQILADDVPWDRYVLLLDQDDGREIDRLPLVSPEMRTFAATLAVQSGSRLLLAGSLSFGGNLFRLNYAPPVRFKKTAVWEITASNPTAYIGESVTMNAVIVGSRVPALSHVTESTLEPTSRPTLAFTPSLVSESGLHRITPTQTYLTDDFARRPSVFVSVEPRPVTFNAPLIIRTLRVGRPAQLSANVSGTGPLTYEWFRDGQPVGKNEPVLDIPSATFADAGLYTVRVTGLAGAAVGNIARLSVGPFAYIKNLSTRARAGEGADNLIVGFVLSGPSPAPGSMLLRGVGPTLANFGVPDYLPTPLLTLFRSGQSGLVGSGSPIGTILRDAATDFGAFPLAISSGDTGMVGPRTEGVYSATLSNSPQFISGNGLVEIYHAGRSAPWLTNVSSRARVGTADDLMIAGLVIEGTGTYPYLIRGIGPALAAYGVTDTLADPVLEIINTATGETVATNDNWDAARAADFAAAGAFPLTTDSKDAALRLDLPPGRYTALLRGVNGTTGVGLIEIYELP